MKSSGRVLSSREEEQSKKKIPIELYSFENWAQPSSCREKVFLT